MATPGPVNRTLLQSYYQNAGDVYDDTKTEGAFGTLADQLDANYDYTSGLVAGGVLQPYPAFLSRQLLINGNFDVWQRGSSFAIGSGTYTADRWQCFRGGFSSGMTVSRQDGSAIYGSKYCLRAQRDLGNSNTAYMQVGQAMESVDSQKLRGKKITLSFYARAGANFSSIGGALGIYLATGTGVDQSAIGAITGLDLLINSSIALTNTWQKYSVTTISQISDSANQLFPYFQYNPTGNAGSNDYFEIAQVQLTAGDQALPFQPKSFVEELALCQRYYEVADQAVQGYAVSSTTIEYPIRFSVNKRIAPTAILLKSSHGIFSPGGGTFYSSGSTLTSFQSNARGHYFGVNGYSVTTGKEYIVNDSNVFGFDAEL